MKLILKPVASLLVMMTCWSGMLYAADVRGMLTRAKAGFEEENESRTARRSGDFLLQSQMNRQSMMNQKNIMMKMQGAQTGVSSQNSSQSNDPGDTQPDTDFEWTEEEFSEPEPIEEPHKPELSVASPMQALLKYGAQVYDWTSEFAEELKRTAQRVFRSVAEQSLSYARSQNNSEAISELTEARAHWRATAFQLAPGVLSIASQAAAFLKIAGVSDSWISGYLLSFSAPEGQDAPPLGLPLIDTLREPNDLNSSQERKNAFVSAKRALKTSYDAAQFVDGLANTYWLNAYFDSDDAGIQMHNEFMDGIYQAAQSYGLALPVSQSLIVMPSKVTYTDELGNTAQSTVKFMNSGSYYSSYPQSYSEYEDSYTYDGLISQDMQRHLSHPSLGWREQQEDGTLTPLADRYADFSGLFKDNPGYQVEFFERVKCLKIIETGNPTKWEFRDPSTDTLLASVVIPGSQMNEENLNPINLGRDIKITETYENGKLGLVTVTDTELGQSLYIQKTKYSQSIKYNSRTGTVYDGIVTNSPDVIEDEAFSIAMHEGLEDYHYFDEFMPLWDFEAVTTDQFQFSSKSAEKTETEVFYHLLPGFNGNSPENEASSMIRFFRNDLIRKNINGHNVRLVPLFEGANIPRDYFSWILEARDLDSHLMNEVVSRLRADYSELSRDELNKKQIVVTYSGSTNPLLKALSKYPDLIVDTVVTYGGPLNNLPRDYKNKHFKTWINVWGSNDIIENFSPYLPIADQLKGYIGPIDLSKQGIRSINIEIKGAEHTDFWYSKADWIGKNNPGRQEINRRTANFLTDLTKAAGKENELQRLLNSPAIDLKNGIYIVDLKKL